jgi:putative ABC transport system permease protein
LCPIVDSSPNLNFPAVLGSGGRGLSTVTGHSVYFGRSKADVRQQRGRLMLGITISDLFYRRRQFLIAILGAALVFAMTLLMSGLAAGFGVEITQTVKGFHADSWVVKTGSSGRIVSLAPFPEGVAGPVAGVPGVVRATPVVVVPQTAQVHGALEQVNLIGSPAGSAPGRQRLTSGRLVAAPGEAVVDSRLGVGVGSRVRVADRPFAVVGVTSDRTLLGGIPNMYVGLRDAQVSAFEGARIISAVVVTGVPTALPPDLHALTNGQIEEASRQQMATAISSINNSKLFMWLIAAVIVASLVYVTALERTRDFAVLKALGASSGKLFMGLALQAMLVALIAAAFAVVLAQFMTGVFKQPIDFPLSAYVVLPLSAIIVGLLSSLIALRRAVAADPAKAFAG